MKQGMSSLNPHAASYVPIHKRENKVTGLMTEKSLKNGYEGTSSNYSSKGHSGIDRSYLQADADHNIHGIQGLHIGNNFTKNGPQNLNEQTKNQFVYEDVEMDLAFLATMFTNMSEQSLADVYSANGGDLEASIDMLNELEGWPVEHLPESLDIGDVSECKVVEGSSMNPKTDIFPGEASGTGSGPLG